MQPADILNATNLSLDNSLLAPLLPNLQGNILKHHGRTHAFHLFLQIRQDMQSAARTWIATFANSKITSSEKQLQDSLKRKSDPEFNGGTFFNLSITASGYKKLNIPAQSVPADPAFTAGLQNRTDVTEDDTSIWEEGFSNEIDLLIIVADSNSSVVTNEKNAILNETAIFADALHVQKGKILRNKHGIGIEHFGYTDGISQPNFLKPANPAVLQWDDDGAILNTLLVQEPGEEVNFGSYFVFRKLEQNVRKFKTAENTLPAVKDSTGAANDELAGAMTVGRFEDGTEVINHSTEKGITDEKNLFNDFDYRDDIPGSITNGSKCPFHAHIRITNPRQDVSIPFAKSVRLTRRGIPFNDIGRDEFDLEGDQPDGGVGLLFMCYQSSIVDQFEFIQQRWANQGDIGGRLVGQDAIIGQGQNVTNKQLPAQWGIDAGPGPIPTAFGNFTTMRGGEYFFTPSIDFLKGL